MHGYGTLIWPDGQRYEGEYLMDKKHGHGTFYFKNGAQYTGSWYKGKRHGEGWIIKGASKKKYLWENGQKCFDAFLPHFNRCQQHVYNMVSAGFRSKGKEQGY